MNTLDPANASTNTQSCTRSLKQKPPQGVKLKHLQYRLQFTIHANELAKVLGRFSHRPWEMKSTMPGRGLVSMKILQLLE